MTEAKIDIKYLDDDIAYKLACLFVGQTEIYDRSLTDLRSKNDPTEAYIPRDLMRFSNSYVLRLKASITDNYSIKWKDIMKEICNHSNYSAQMWVDEYVRLWINE